MPTKQILKFFKHPKNMGILKNPDGKSETVSAICGDTVSFYLNVKNEKISEIKFSTTGCMAMVASSQCICELAINKTPREASKISFNQINKALGCLPEHKTHCLENALDAYHQALLDYLSK